MAEDDDYDTDDEATVEAPEIPSPRENPLLVGHPEAEATLLQAFNSGRLPHAWLITGKRGIGKATLAYRFARFLLAEGAAGGGLFAVPATSLAVAPAHQAYRLVVSGGHPDLFVVERTVNEKTKRLRSVIVIEDAAKVAEFLHKTSALGGWRVVIVDGADTLNKSAENSLLKILEEPPKQTVLMLTSDNPGRLLATTRSRCRTLVLKPLSEENIIALLQRYRPDLSSSDVAILTRLGDGSIGRALDLAASDGMALYSRIFSLLRNLPDLDVEELHGFAEKLGGRGGEDNFSLLGELLPDFLARLVALGAAQGRPVSSEEERVMRNLAGRRGLDQWVTVWEKLTHLFAQAEGINLDRKQVVLNAFFVLEEAAR
jgi:DNA polymerase-3 subunit delta'